MICSPEFKRVRIQAPVNVKQKRATHEAGPGFCLYRCHRRAQKERLQERFGHARDAKVDLTAALWHGPLIRNPSKPIMTRLKTTYDAVDPHPKYG